MGRLLIVGALVLGALLVLNDGKLPQASTAGGGGGAVSGYTGASSAAIRGIAG